VLVTLVVLRSISLAEADFTVTDDG
jgi:hypothetical protein